MFSPVIGELWIALASDDGYKIGIEIHIIMFFLPLLSGLLLLFGGILSAIARWKNRGELLDVL